ncbi:hypothetical protein [Fusibacter bizertensis]
MKIEEIISAKSKKELEEIGTVAEIVNVINHAIQPLHVSCDNYEKVLHTIKILKEKWLDFKEGPFTSKQKEMVFYLTKLDGNNREKCLGINDEHYENKKIAEKWYKNIAKYVHPDKLSNNETEAFIKLNELYNNLIDYDENEIDTEGDLHE